ncbi:hypothetical protein PV08_05291 [Exophiala spinifera]|uniref:Enoyl reductase (ER) domain-containing protein n=1 Tax=Exophiala spinifera TaxID=91928 RepID=A0A0D1YJT9_9EURO|nr:uncharacterized protein PV08_05291 [Exophiala spinifera]KIW15246.1 hypothetical protein PV08_05291 [Exophiala spinifera]
MKEAFVSPDLSVTIRESAIPEPGPAEILVKVICSGCNPKDWKYPAYSGATVNSGDDVAGEVVRVGGDVYEFRAGDRVAGMHIMRTRGGSFAEYAILPASTTFHLPNTVSFEEAATIPLAALTASVALYHNLRLPYPWEQSTKRTPVLIYGGTSAIGTFAIKLALRSNIHPLIIVAGQSRDTLGKLLQESQGDAIIDYREGPSAVAENMQKALKAANAGPAYHAFDAISEGGSFQTLSKVLAPQGHITVVLPEADYSSIPSPITTSLTYVGVVHTGAPALSALKGINSVAEGDGKDVGFIFSRLFGRGLAEGWFSPHAHRMVPRGLDGLSDALQSLKGGKARAVKYIIRPQDTVKQ